MGGEAYVEVDEMSDAYYIACKECNKYIWIGQRGAGSTVPYTYLGDGKTHKKLSAFLIKHERHHLVFDFQYAFEDYEEDFYMMKFPD